MTYPAWDETWLEVCGVMARRAKCTRRQVGAVVVKDNRLISSGYNGAPPNRPHCTDGACPRGLLKGPLPEDYEKYPCIAVHAELNALLRAGSEAEGAELYCTDKPCLQCQNAIMGAKIMAVFWPGEHPDDPNVWGPRSGYIDGVSSA